jgi:acetyl esterase/lipase
METAARECPVAKGNAADKSRAAGLWRTWRATEGMLNQGLSRPGQTMLQKIIMISLSLGTLAAPAAGPVSEPRWDSTAAHEWKAPYERISIPSSLDGAMQNAYIYRTTSARPMPLVVSLHTWSGDYSQHDGLSELVAKKNWNFIHPDFRGSNTTPDSCASRPAIQDIEDAIAYALKNMPVDADNIFVVGTSGGGHASCVTYLSTHHPIRAAFAWVPITDLEAWYYQSQSRRNKYAADLLAVTGSVSGVLDSDEARRRSPLHMPLPHDLHAPIHLYAGIEDGYTGSVPVSHALHFYNRMASLSGKAEHLVPDSDIIALLARGKPQSPDPETSIGGRKVLYHRESPLASITIFQGGHEMLVDYCFGQIEEIAASPQKIPGATEGEQKRE